MATYSYPTAPWARQARLEWGLRPNVIVNTSRFSGAVERIELPGSRWVATLTFPDAHADSDDACEREAFWMKIGGPANLVRLWHQMRPLPRGTLRGNPTIAAAVAQGATVLQIDASPGETLRAADMIGAGGMLFGVVTGGVANGSGVLQVSVAPPARAALADGATVEWDRPTGLFMPTGEIRVPYDVGRVQRSFSVDLVEVW